MAPLGVDASVAPTVALSAVRDSTFYTWRFHDGPAQKQPAFVIVDRGRPIGACSLEVMNEGRSLRIVDVMAVPGAWHQCLAAITAYAADTDAHFVDIKLFSLDGRRRAMWRYESESLAARYDSARSENTTPQP